MKVTSENETEAIVSVTGGKIEESSGEFTFFIGLELGKIRHLVPNSMIELVSQVGDGISGIRRGCSFILLAQFLQNHGLLGLHRFPFLPSLLIGGGPDVGSIFITVTIHGAFRGVVEESQQLKVLSLQNRIVFMGMATGANQRESE